jgi:hypothetical protein
MENFLLAELLAIIVVLIIGAVIYVGILKKRKTPNTGMDNKPRKGIVCDYIILERSTKVILQDLVEGYLKAGWDFAPGFQGDTKPQQSKTIYMQAMYRIR